MENEVKKSNKSLLIIVYILLFVIVLLSGYIIYDKLIKDDSVDNNLNQNINNNGNINENIDNDNKLTSSKLTLNGIYKKGDIIRKDTSGYDYDMLVVNDGDDYVTVLINVDLMNISDNYHIEGEEYNRLSNDYYGNNSNRGISYDDSYIKKYVDSKKAIFNDKLELKIVDGYEIRLPKVEEITSLNDNYTKNEYGWSLEPTKANKDVMDIIGGLTTMSSTNYTGSGKVGNFYSTGLRNVSTIDSTVAEYFIDTWSSGIMPFKPVVNISK